MPVMSLVRRLVAMPAAALTIGERLLETIGERLFDDLGRLHQQMDRASDEVALTRAAVEHATARLDVLIDLSRRAIGDMEDATSEVQAVRDQVGRLTPLAQQATTGLAEVASAMDQVPGIDAAEPRPPTTPEA